eukprot:9241511-Pyramimonas_sp.AAC.1
MNEHDTHIITDSNLQVLQKFRMASLFLELRIRRLKWLQTMAARKEYHAQYLSAVFGNMVCGGEVFREGYAHVNSNPWARQAQQDIL